MTKIFELINYMECMILDVNSVKFTLMGEDMQTVRQPDRL